MNYRKRYNPIYRLWELEREQRSGFGSDTNTWRVVACYETEAEIDTELARRTTERKVRER